MATTERPLPRIAGQRTARTADDVVTGRDGAELVVAGFLTTPRVTGHGALTQDVRP